MTFTPEQLDFVARVLRDGKGVGTGILVSPNEVITCAHVVLADEEWKHYKRDPTSNIAEIDSEIVIEIQDRHIPIILDGDNAPLFHPQGEDVVLITLEEDVSANPATFATGFDEKTARELENRRLNIYGYPKGQENRSVVGAKGDRFSPEFTDAETKGLSTFALPHRVVEGYSGGPVVIEDTEKPVCIGMVILGGEGRLVVVGLGSDLIGGFYSRLRVCDVRSLVSHYSEREDDDLHVLRDATRFLVEHFFESRLSPSVDVSLSTRNELVASAMQPVLGTGDSLQPTSLQRAFVEANQFLAIFGAPGAGKTFALISLARELVKEASTSCTPVVLNLGSYRPMAFEKWLVRELQSTYSIPVRDGRKWISNNRLVILLDGLDECHPNVVSCIRSINAFVKKQRRPGLVVTSRTQVYCDAVERLKLNSAIELNSLSRDQIVAFCSAMKKDYLSIKPQFSELPKTPLYLEAVCRASSHDRETTESPAEGKDLREAVLNRYVMSLRGRWMSKYSKRKSSRRIASLIDIKWFAKELEDNDVSAFSIDDLQPIFLSTRSKAAYFLLSRLAGFACIGTIFFLGSYPFFDTISCVSSVALLFVCGCLQAYLDYYRLAARKRFNLLWGGAVSIITLVPLLPYLCSPYLHRPGRLVVFGVLLATMLCTRHWASDVDIKLNRIVWSWKKIFMPSLVSALFGVVFLLVGWCYSSPATVARDLSGKLMFGISNSDAVSVSAGGRRILTADGAMFDTDTGRRSSTLDLLDDESADTLKDSLWNRQGTALATDHALYDTTTGKAVRELDGSEYDFSRDGSKLLFWSEMSSNSQDRQFHLVGLDGNAILRQEAGDAAFVEDGEKLISLSRGRVDWWDASSGRHIHKLNVDKADLSPLETVIFAQENGWVRVRNASDGKELWGVKDGAYDSIVFSENDSVIAMRLGGAPLKVWETQGDGTPRCDLDTPLTNPIIFNREGTRCIIGDSLWNAVSGESLGDVGEAQFSSSGRYIVQHGGDGSGFELRLPGFEIGGNEATGTTLVVRLASTGQTLVRADEINSYKISPTESHVVTVSNSGQVCLVDLAVPERESIYVRKTDYDRNVSSILFCPDAQRFGFLTAPEHWTFEMREKSLCVFDYDGTPISHTEELSSASVVGTSFLIRNSYFMSPDAFKVVDAFSGREIGHFAAKNTTILPESILAVSTANTWARHIPIGLAVFLLGFTYGILHSTTSPDSRKRYSGFWLSFFKAGMFATLLSFPTALALDRWIQFDIFFSYNFDGWQFMLFYSIVFPFIFFGLGGRDLGRHILLRFLLVTEGRPLKLRRLLDSSVDMGILRRFGRRYVFHHQEIRQFLANRSEPN